jgi:E3 ubiquitin-protein ligase CCNP1IP1
MARGLTEKYQLLSNQLDKVIHDANVEVARLQEKVTKLTVSEDDLRKKNHELMEGWREKARRLAQTQVREAPRHRLNRDLELTILIKDLYDKLKRKTLMTQVGQAAAENLERVLGYDEQQQIHDLTTPGPGFRQKHRNRQPPGRKEKSMPEPDFMMTGARIGTINGATRTGSKSSSGGRRTPVPPLFGNGPSIYTHGMQSTRSYSGTFRTDLRIDV